MLTTNFITTRLNAVAAECGIIIRYANESGSRAWSLASTDSDYDVRFVYQHHREWYLRLDRPKDMIGPIMELDGELDLVGWDIRKVLSHIAGSNAGVIEWLHSPVVYFEDEAFLTKLRELATSYFQPAKVAAHYLGIARSAELAGYDEAAGDWNLKKYFYYLRPIMAADFVIHENRNPPVAFAELQDRIPDPEIRSLLNELIAHKATVGEGHRMAIPHLLVRHFSTLRESTTKLLEGIPRRTTDRAAADALFRDLIGY